MRESVIFAGIPVVINPHMPADEVWIIEQGKKIEIHVHEGPHAGETVEVWLKKPVVRRLKIGLPDGRGEKV